MFSSQLLWSKFCAYNGKWLDSYVSPRYECSTLTEHCATVARLSNLSNSRREGYNNGGLRGEALRLLFVVTSNQRRNLSPGTDCSDNSTELGRHTQRQNRSHAQKCGMFSESRIVLVDISHSKPTHFAFFLCFVR